MTVAPDKVTRFAADLVDSATVEGARQSRSGKQQLDHWARVGRAVSEHPSVPRRRVEAVLSGELPMRDLHTPELVVANAEIDAAIDENLRATHYGQALHRSGVTVVALDDDGRLVRYLPDGSQERVSDDPTCASTS